MDKLLAIVVYALSLFGVDIGNHTFIDRIRVDGADTFYSRVVARAGVTRFECLRSGSGQCYYTVYPRGCTRPAVVAGSASTRANDCLSKPVERFVLAKGASRQIPALPGFHWCVSTDAAGAGADCDLPELLAAR